jgi:murein DD-endopeptidase MepM/ murein hydrolase activator NlpD
MHVRRAFAHRCFNELDFTGGSIWFMFPTVERVTSGFMTPERPDHYGVDFAESGTHEIHASAGGIVTRSDVSATYGEVVYILHNFGGQEYETVYAHMKTGSRTVQLGDTVTQGQVLGIMGNTGDSEGQHLHFELHRGRWNLAKTNAIDPMTMLGKFFGGHDPESEKSKISIFHLWLSKALPNWSG